MTKIKICGVTTCEQALAVARAKADFTGLVLQEEQAAEIAEILRWLKPRPLIAGIFVNTSIDEINRIAGKCRLDWVQLSGDEDWEYCTHIERPVIKAIHIYKGASAKQVLHTAEEGYRIIGRDRLIYLLDTGVKDAYGGTGLKFNWDIARQIISRYPVIIAGGLNPENVGDLIARFNPWGVDVSSGVEVHGQKEASMIEAFVQAVRSSEKE